VARSEAEIVEACLNGNSGAWDELYRLYYAKIRRIIGFRRWGFSANEVEDGIQEVFLEVVRCPASEAKPIFLRSSLVWPKIVASLIYARKLP
jgi:DNA-directed RNA polymerase specialized sigma24 family protein